MDLGVVTDVDRQGALEDDVSHAGGLRVYAREVAQFGDEALTGGVVRREGAGARFDDQCRACLTREAGELEIFASALVYIWRTRGDDDAPYSCENAFNPYQP